MENRLEVNFKTFSPKHFLIFLKEQFTQKRKDAENLITLFIQDKFVSLLEQIWRNVACLTMDPLQWMGAIRMRVQTADKNSTMIYK